MRPWQKQRMKYIPVFARVLFVLIFLLAAPRHFSAEGIKHATDLGVPLAWLFVPASGVLAIVSALAIASGYQVRWGAWGLVLFLVPVTFGMHAFWRVSDPTLVHVQQAMFAKNLSMLGAALWLASGSSAPP
jgi:putative oxidoreductase